MRIISGVYWDRGGRAVNQDSLAFQQVLTSRGRMVLAAVSDGIGGLAEGEKASGFITEKLVEDFYDKVISLAGRGKGRRALMNCLLRCFYDINRELRRYVSGREERLGATVSVLLLWKRRYMILHLGDSRIYLCRRGRLRQLTVDHTARGGITRCLGSFPFQRPYICSGRIRRKSGFLLCTDGFYRSFDGEIPRVLHPGEIRSDEQIERRLREIGIRAGQRGEKDNLSAVYLIASGSVKRISKSVKNAN